MLALSRLTNTAATRSRSSPRPVSFSNDRGEHDGLLQRLEGQVLAALRPSLLGRLARLRLHADRGCSGAALPRSTMKVSGSSEPSAGTVAISPERLASALSFSTI
jgi:hypothetical protein